MLRIQCKGLKVPEYGTVAVVAVFSNGKLKQFTCKILASKIIVIQVSLLLQVFICWFICLFIYFFCPVTSIFTQNKK